jgi:hypothetical protein
MRKRLITVATFDDGIRAALAKNHLEASGIAAVLNDELTVTTGWALSGAVGGIKLQVTPLYLERAEHVLAQLSAHLNDDLDLSSTDEERAAAAEEDSPSNQLAERAFRTAVVGLLLWPLSLYVWWLLLSIMAESSQVSPGRRWKVWTAGLLTVPLMSAFLLVISITPPPPKQSHYAAPGAAQLTPAQ